MVSDLTLDSRAVTPGSAVPRPAAAAPTTGSSSPPRPWRAARARCSTNGRGCAGGARAGRGHFRGRGARPQCARRASSPTASSMPPRSTSPWPASPAPTARPPAPGSSPRRLSTAAAGGATSARSAAGVPPRADPGPAHDRRCGDACSASWRRCARSGAACVGDGGVLARARPGARQRRALPHRRLHQPDARSPRLPRHDGGVRRRQGAAVRLARARASRHQRRRCRSAATLAAAASRVRAHRHHARRRHARCRRGATSCAPPRSRPTRAASFIEIDVELRARRSAACASSANSTSTTCSPCSRCCWPGEHPARARPRAPCRAAAPPAAAWKCSAAAARTPLAIVDYAHTPDALDKALRAARLHCRGQLRVRVRLRRRPRRGQAPADGAGRRGARRRHHRHRRQPAQRGSGAHRRRHRRRALRSRAPLVIEHDRAARHPPGARQRSVPDDVVLIAGKGHEDYQIVGDERRAVPRPGAWSRARAREAAGMKRTLAEFARACGGHLRRGPTPPSATWSSDSRTLTRRAAVRRPRAAELRRPRVRRRRRGAPARPARSSSAPRSRWRCRRSWCADTQAALERARARLARARSPARWSASPAATARPPPRR